MQPKRNTRSSPKIIHPWRLAPTLDGVSINRSFRFAALLDKLPPKERQTIEAAERAYLSKTRAPNSFHSRVAQDFSEGMQGLRDHEPEPT